MISTKRAVIVYGSLLLPDELRKVVRSPGERALRAKVSGFERVFDAEADWRETTGDQRAVLNLHENSSEWFNALLLPGLDENEYNAYAERETGYRFVEIDRNQISFYADKDEHSSLPAEIIVAIDAPACDDVAPIPSYLELCLEGARYWGSEFYWDFLSTTRLSSGERLARVVDRVT